MRSTPHPGPAPAVWKDPVPTSGTRLRVCPNLGWLLRGRRPPPARRAVASGPTVLERMRSAGINEARALQHLSRGWVRVDGQVVTDPDHAAPPPARLLILP